MYQVLLAILLILSVILIAVIFIQPAKNQSSNVFDAGTGALFERSKARGFEAVMQRITAILVAIWMLVALALVVISSTGM
ncbi:TPA: preprotein translocase subunit SecG [Streptococcus suis]|uniref:Protein-export membrane protein SecG n=1 Tax=Streptococcus suivaginalis TaxID=3028082 RepID=A0AA96VCZ6_9STRE|nr:preprotein translocase subunit SecG [Streptococcus sp. 29896]MBL6538843.1 preprotein translocase subunit SecG [Streptococcus suis]MBM7315567.1 preprotein translocase subunit SecG [Streptococcus suis]MCK4028445.1 preprotein translocase subunit SecG [Streptococcus suis]NQG97169.1 preprotein translocase subunit SecG [Streptococcus suis]WNY46558.1 preprotein translocase subunit SecG [Streptococcus sp. 29896]